MSATDIHQTSQNYVGPEGNLWAFIDTIPALVWSALPDGSHDFVNRRWLEYTGLSVEESLGMGWKRAFHPENLNRFEGDWKAALVDKRPLQTEVRLRNAQGQYRWFSTVAAPVCHGRGDVVKWYGTHTDIEDRKSMEALPAGLEVRRSPSRDRLLRNEAYLAEAQRLSRTGSFSWWPASGEIAWSDETFRIYEYDRELEPTLDLARQRIHPGDLAAFQERVRSAPVEGRDFEFEHRLLLPDGRVKHVRVVARAVRDDSGRLVEYFGAVTDITAQKNTQEALEIALQETENLKAQFRLAIDTIPGLVWTGQPDGCIDFLNQRWLEYTGMSMEEAAGWDWQPAIHPDDVTGLVEYWRGVLASGEAGEIEARLRRSDGAYRWFLFRAVPLRDEAGHLVKWYGQTTDIDDRKRAEALLAGEKDLLEMTARGDPLPSILDRLCRLVEQNEPGCLCSIVLVDPTGTRLEHGAAPGLPDAFNQAIHGRPVELDGGPCGMAAALKEQVIATDIATETRWSKYGWCRHALKYGLKACWSTPVFASGGKVLGTFAIYFREPRSPAAEHHGLIDQFVHLASIAIERTSAEDALRRNEAYLLRMPLLDGVGAITEIRRADAAARIVLLTTYDTDNEIYQAIKAGARGYLLKDARREELLDCIRRVNAGETCIPAALTAKLAVGLSGESLTERELGVLTLLASGKSNKEIAARLFISETTVKSHLRSIFSKLNVVTRTEAVAAASRRGLVRL